MNIELHLTILLLCFIGGPLSYIAYTCNWPLEKYPVWFVALTTALCILSIAVICTLREESLLMLLYILVPTLSGYCIRAIGTLYRKASDRHLFT